jgi:hypothetical protein
MPHRRDGIQPEVCDLCGRLRPQAELVVSDVEGLRGRKVCMEHGSLPFAPSYHDYKRYSPGIPQVETSRQQPVGSTPLGVIYGEDP